MGNHSSRAASGVHDTEAFFFEQTTFRRTPKRYKKSPDELPDDLKFAHLNPKVAAFLANKERERSDNNLDFDDGLGSKSLLPEINRTVSLLRNRLDSLLSTEEDQQRQQFHDSKTTAPGLLVCLAKYLYLWKGLHVTLPRSLEYNLTSTFTTLIGEIYVAPREWQILSNKEEYLTKTLNSEMTSQKAEDNTRPETVMSISKSTDDGEINNGSKELTADGRSLSRSKSKFLSRTNTLAEINELVENSKDSAPRSVSRQTVQGDNVPKIIVSKKESREKGEAAKPKAKLEKHRSNLHLDVKLGGTESRRGMRKDTESVLGEPVTQDNSKWLNSGAKDAGYWAVINFQLSNALYEEMGWIVHPTNKNDPERDTILEWATQRLQICIKMKKSQDEELREQGLDKQPVFRYYGDSRKEMVEKYKSTARSGSAGSSKNNPVYKGEKPKIPDVEAEENKLKRPFLATTSDGATTVFYPTGRPAIVMCSVVYPTNEEEKPEKPKTPAFYTLVYDNTPERKMLAAFTPYGRHCIYHNNGKVKFLCDRSGGTLSTEEGAIQRRWDWPVQHKLPVPVIFQISNHLTFRCMNLTQMHLQFNCEKEVCKINVGAVPGFEEPSREDLGHLISGSTLSSQASKEFAKPYKPRSQTQVTRAKKPLKSKRSKAELERLVNFPEDTENDEEADKDLFKLQRKVKNIVEDWLEHYRMAMSIASPYLKAVRDMPTKRIRDIKSAKPGGGIVIIEREATAVPRPRVSVRARSAYIARDDRPSTASSAGERRSPMVSHTTKSQVKFEDTVQSVGHTEYDAQSVSRTTTFAGSLPGSAGSRSSRSCSAPQGQQIMTQSCTYGDPGVNPNVALCPIALRLSLLGHQRVMCRCSRHKIPNISDVEFDEFIQNQAPDKQLVIVAIKSSLAPAATPAENMLEQLHDDRNRNRTKPCMQSRNDPYRLFWYDVISASDFSDHAQPLLIRRHNVVPGMFLVYESGNLVFCDHIFNGYGNAKRDFQKQLAASRRAAILGHTLPKDFKFSPLKGRPGMRSGWGGEIGGVYSGSKKTAEELKRVGSDERQGSLTSLSSGDSKDMPVDYTISGVSFSTSQTSKKNNSGTSVSFSKSTRRHIRPLSQPNFESQDTNISKLSRPKSQIASSSIRMSLPEIESSA